MGKSDIGSFHYFCHSDTLVIGINPETALALHLIVFTTVFPYTKNAMQAMESHAPPVVQWSSDPRYCSRNCINSEKQSPNDDASILKKGVPPITEMRPSLHPSACGTCQFQIWDSARTVPVKLQEQVVTINAVIVCHENRTGQTC